MLGFGAATLGGEYGTKDKAEGERAVQAAIDAGVTYFDVAPYYGRTLAEERLTGRIADYALFRATLERMTRSHARRADRLLQQAEARKTFRRSLVAEFRERFPAQGRR